MSTETPYRAETTNPTSSDLQQACLAGLAGRPKMLPSRFFYDFVGSELFERITELEEYYVTRTEIALLELLRQEIGQYCTRPTSIVEFGAGSARKTPLLLRAFPDLPRYLPIDISEDFLGVSVETLREKFPRLAIQPLIGDFTRLGVLRRAEIGEAPLGFFPGSTLGNLDASEARHFLAEARGWLGPRSMLLIGLDLVKPVEMLVRAYDDAKGVTAAFNLNLLARLNRELGADFELAAFAHQAIWNPVHERIEMHLRALRHQIVTIGAKQFSFIEGETIHTENCHKYRTENISHMAEEAGWSVAKDWVDNTTPYGLFLLQAKPTIRM